MKEIKKFQCNNCSKHNSNYVDDSKSTLSKPQIQNSKVYWETTKGYRCFCKYCGKVSKEIH